MLKSKLTVAVLAVLAFGRYSPANAQTAPANAPTSSQRDTTVVPDTDQAQITNSKKSSKVMELEAITVTGSLIPQTQIETATPIITITSTQMKQQGFTSVSQALQQASFSTGSVGGAQQNSFTPGAQTLSMFGLPVGFTKFLINGRPMGNFPALYSGSNVFNNIGSIPFDLVDHIDILPGGQSSLYGSDAIAGVINIVLKKEVDAPTIDLRYGWYPDGGGANRTISFADSFSLGRWTSLVGVEFETAQPIWGRDRSLTKQFSNGQGAAQANPGYLVSSLSTGQYYFMDPNNCTKLSNEWSGTLAKQNWPGVGDWCGSLYAPGDATYSNGKKKATLYTHNTFDISSNLRLYGDLLYNYQEQNWSAGAMGWSSDLYGSPFYDQNLGVGNLKLTRQFSPEEVGGYQNIMSGNYDKSYMLTLGAQGFFGQSNWDYDFTFTHSDHKLIERSFNRFLSMGDYFDEHVLGPQLGSNGSNPIYEPNYLAFYTPITPAIFRSFAGHTTNNSKTWNNELRGQLTNASLFSLPGGDAGVAVVLEGGNEGWSYVPDPRYLNGDVYGSFAASGAGHRSRFAATTELRFPVLPSVTLDVSGRYDDYKVSGEHVSQPTYNLGVEYRPVDTLLLRARYGTAFKVPTLADEFLGSSGFGNIIPDYLNCGRQGNGGANIANCKPPYNQVLIFGTTSGNPALQPITAKVWSYGIVWAPVKRMSISVDYLHWSLDNEVGKGSSDLLSKIQYLCDIGNMDANSEKCTNAFSQLKREPIGVGPYLGALSTVNLPKINISNERVNAITAAFRYTTSIGPLGDLGFSLSYSNELRHDFQRHPNNPPANYLDSPGLSTEFKTKSNGSITWSKDKWRATVYASRVGRSPNYSAWLTNGYSQPGTAKLPAWLLYNASVGYQPIPRLGLLLSVNNVFNKMPPIDTSYGNSSRPYNSSNYNVYGRAITLELNYKFGDSSGN